jgi:hypothetical protein
MPPSGNADLPVGCSVDLPVHAVRLTISRIALGQQRPLALPFLATEKWVPHLFRGLIAEKVGNLRPNPAASRLPPHVDSAPFSWRGPAEGSWPHRRWPKADVPTVGGRWSTLSSPLKNGCSIFSAVSSRKRWETSGPTQPHPDFHHTSIPRLFPGADRPKAVGPTAGGRWLQIIAFPARTIKT